MPRKTKIGTQVAHVTFDSDTTFEVKRSKVKVTRLVYSPRRLRTGRCSGQRPLERIERGNCCYVAVCRLTICLTLIGALVVTHAMLRRLTSLRCIIIIIIVIVIIRRGGARCYGAHAGRRGAGHIVSPCAHGLVVT